jgi:two-component system chemotaxis sensor kinase CheA
MNLDQVLQMYIAESRSLLQEMEDGLLGLEHAPGDAELIAALFRAAHTIKGSAGMFGLDAVVAFTHVVENLLDALREGRMAVSVELIGLLLECRDHIALLIDAVAHAGAVHEAALVPGGEPLLAALRTHLARADLNLDADADAKSGQEVEADDVLTWHIALQFGPDVLRNGMDPASIILYLGTLGQVASLQLGCPNMPDIEAMDPESCYLNFDIVLIGRIDQKTIAGAFEFVRDDCLITITEVPDAGAQVDLAATGQASATALVTEMNAASATALTGFAEGAPQGNPVRVDLLPGQRARTAASKEAKFIRVNADKLDQLIDLVGELIIASASTALLARRSGNSALSESTAVITGFVEAIREDALRLRMVEIGDTFNRFQRLVRDTGRELNKAVGLKISGGDTELDKVLVEKIVDPLTHLVRNAMDHGIESGALREARGKPPGGTVSLNAYHDSGSIVIEVADDGGGLDRDKILAKAIERDLVPLGVALPDNEIFKLIFEAGFSTAASITNLSGRGVGLDVVKRNIHALRGSVDVDSRAAIGTTVRIRLPLTLAIIDGFLVEVGKTSFVVPLTMVLECLELSPLERQAERQVDYINLRGEVLPLIDLRRSFDLVGQGGRRENVVVVRCNGKKAGLVVDTLLGELQTVIKPLGQMFSQVRCLSGSTILGSGEVALILDVSVLMEQAGTLAASGQQSI